MTTNQVAESSDPPKLRGPWRDHDLHPTSWIEETGNIATAFAYATLLWPDFVEYRGAVFLARAFDATVADQWFEALNGSTKADRSSHSTAASGVWGAKQMDIGVGR